MAHHFWTAAEDKLFSTLPADEVAKRVGVSSEAAARRLRRLHGAQYHEDRESHAVLKDELDVLAWRERLINEIRTSAGTLKPLKPKVLPNPDKNSEMALLFSDLQYGALITRRETGGLAEYSSAIAEARVTALAAQVIAIQKAHPVRHLNVWLLGDLIEGVSIFAGQAFQVDQHSVAQSLRCGQLLAEFVRSVSPYFADGVSVVGVLGNHGRNGRKGEQPVADNLDVVAMKYGEALAAGLKKVTWQIEDETWFALVKKFGRRYLLTHGDDLSLSLAGAEKFVSRWRTLVGGFDVACVGHHHTPTTLLSGALRVNSSFVGSSGYSLKRMGLGNNRSQTLLGIGASGVIWERYLQLDDDTTTRLAKDR